VGVAVRHWPDVGAGVRLTTGLPGSAAGAVPGGVRHRGLRVPAITWYRGRCRCSPGHRVTGMSRLAGAGRSVTSRPAGTGDHLGPVPPGRALPIGVGHRFPGTGVCRSGGWLSRWDTCLMSVPGWPGCRAGAGHRTYPHELMNGERICGSGLGIKECLGDQEVYDDRRRVRERNCY